MTQIPNHILEGVVKSTAPPPGLPNRLFRDCWFLGLQETKESKQKTHDYKVFMEGYQLGVDSQNSQNPDVPNPHGPIGESKDRDY